MLLKNMKWMMVIGVVGLLAGSAGANVILSDGFESGTSAWYVEGESGVSTVNSPMYEGTQALKLMIFEGGNATLQRRFSNETARSIELTMWVYIPANSVNERTLDIELRDPNQEGTETPGPYVLFNGSEGLGVFTNHTGWSADFTKVADIVPNQWTKLVIRTDVGSRKMTIEYNGVVYNNNGEGYGWATETLNALGKIKLTGPTTGTNATCYIDGLTVNETVLPKVGTLFSDGFEGGVANWGYAETWNGITSNGDIVHGGLMSLMLSDINDTAAVMASRFTNPNAQEAMISIWVYIPSTSVNARTLEITLHDTAQTTEEHGPYILFKEGGQGLGFFSNFGWWGADYTKITNTVTDKWTNLVVYADIVNHTMTIKYDGVLYDNGGLGYPWGSSTLKNLNKIVIWGPSTLGAVSYIDDLLITDGEVQRVPGDANGDKMVDVGDLGILAANYGGIGKNWSQGDFNGDGLVDVGDLGILAANYGTNANVSTEWAADYAKAFSTTVTNDTATEDSSSSICSSLGLPLIAGLALMGLMLVKVKE
jgi:hypothetical protein